MIRFRPLPLMTGFALAALVVLISLGVWQLQRLAWKSALLDEIAARAEAAPVGIDDVAARLEAGEGWRYQPVRLSGVYLHEYEARMPSATPAGSGWRVVTPFQPDGGGSVVFIDRGLAPARALEAGGSIERPQGPVELVGLARPFARHAPFTPPPDLSARIIYDLERAPLEAILDAPPDDVAPFMVSLTPSASSDARAWPRAAPPSIDDISNRHLEYALTWFGLAGALIAVYVAFHIRAGRFGAQR